MLPGMRRLVLFAMFACGRTNSAAAPQPAPAPPALAPKAPPMTIYQVHSDADLGAPLLAALGAAEKANAGTFTVELAAGSYQRLELESDSLALTVTGPGQFAGVVSLRGRAVTLRGLSIINARPAASALVIAASEIAELSHISIVASQSASSAAEGDPLVDLIARKKGATAKIDHLWIVDSQASALVRVPAVGPGRWASVAMSEVVFACNRGKVGLAIAGLDPAGTGLAITNAFVAEPGLTETWLHLATARPVTVRHAVLALGPELSDGDGKATVSDAQTVKPPPKLDPKPFVEAAKAGTTDRAQLRELLK